MALDQLLEMEAAGTTESRPRYYRWRKPTREKH